MNNNQKGKNNPNYKEGKYSDNKSKCKICGKELSMPSYILCKEHYLLTLKGNTHPMYNKHHTKKSKNKMSKKYIGKTISKKIREKISKSIRGKNHPNWEGGLKTKKYYCIKCKKKRISYETVRKGKKRCCKCANKLSIKKRMKNRNMKGKSNPNWKSKKIIAYCMDCKKETKNRYAKRCTTCYIEWLKNNCKNFNRASRKGIKNSNWRGGISYSPYSVEWTNELKTYIRKKYNYKCLVCKQKGNSVHHIDYAKDNCEENNLINLCINHHAKTNGNRDYWYSYFNYIIREMEKSTKEEE